MSSKKAEVIEAERAAPESRAQSKYRDVAARSLVGVELHRTANYRGDIVSDCGEGSEEDDLWCVSLMSREVWRGMVFAEVVVVDDDDVWHNFPASWNRGLIGGTLSAADPTRARSSCRDTPRHCTVDQSGLSG